MKELNLQQMENVYGGMPCAVAVGFYVLAFVTAAATTGGLAILGAIGIGGTIWGIVDNCKYKL